MINLNNLPNLSAFIPISRILGVGMFNPAKSGVKATEVLLICNWTNDIKVIVINYSIVTYLGTKLWFKLLSTGNQRLAMLMTLSIAARPESVECGLVSSLLCETIKRGDTNIIFYPDITPAHSNFKPYYLFAYNILYILIRINCFYLMTYCISIFYPKSNYYE